MKHLMITTAFVVATAGAAFAQDMEMSQQRQLVAQSLETYQMDVDISSLSDDQVSRLFLIANGTDSTSQKQDDFRRVLSEANVMEDPEASEGAMSEGSMSGGAMSGGAMSEGDEVMVEVNDEMMPRSQLANSVSQMLETYEMDVDVNSLSDQQLSELYLIDTSDNEGDTDERQQIEAVLDM